MTAPVLATAARLVDAAQVLEAADHLEDHGLLKGGYGERGGPCDTVGHLAAVIFDLRIAQQAVGWAFKRWPGRPAVNRGCGCVVCWNDGPATEADAAAFYAWWADELDRTAV